MTSTSHRTAALDSRRSWLIAGAAATSMFAVYGVTYSFGAFFNSMSDEFGVGSGETAFFFSATVSLSFLLGLFTGRWADRVGPRPVLLAGAASMCLGLLLTAAAPNIWFGYLTYGIGVGFAVACGYIPMVAAVGSWFEQKRASALGVAVAGIGLGTMVGSPTAARLIDATSWRTTYVIFAVVATSLMLLAATVAEQGPAAQPSAKPKSLKQLLSERDFVLLYASSIFVSLALFVPFVFVADYAEDRGISSVQAALLVGTIGGASVVGRLGLGALADRLGVTRLYVGSFAIMAVSHAIWLLSGDRYWQLVLYTVVLGLGYGGFIALSPAVVAERFGLEGIGGILGTLYTAAAIGSLIGPPAAGVLIDNFGYNTAIVGAVVCSGVGFVILLPLAAIPPSVHDHAR